MHNLNICDYNIQELISDRKLSSEEGNLLYNSQNTRNTDSLGFVNFTGQNMSGISITKWNSLFYKDVNMVGYNSTPVLSLHFMLNGDVLFRNKRGSDVVANSGTHNLWFLNEGDVGINTFNKNTKCQFYCIYIHQEYFKELVNRYPDMFEKVYNRFMTGESFNYNSNYLNTTLEMSRIVSQIEDADLMGRCSKLYIEAKVMELLSYQFRDYMNNDENIFKVNSKSKVDIEKIREAKRILLSNLNEPPTIRELSRNIGINELYLKRGFKEVYHQTIYGYLFEYKMNLACNLLLNSTKTIIDVANVCGYDNASHFTTAFRRKFGINPREFRKKG